MRKGFEFDGGVGFRSLDGEKGGDGGLRDDGYFGRAIAKIVVIEEISLFYFLLDFDILF